MQAKKMNEHIMLINATTDEIQEYCDEQHCNIGDFITQTTKELYNDVMETDEPVPVFFALNSLVTEEENFFYVVFFPQDFELTKENQSIIQYSYLVLSAMIQITSMINNLCDKTSKLPEHSISMIYPLLGELLQAVYDNEDDPLTSSAPLVSDILVSIAGVVLASQELSEEEEEILEFAAYCTMINYDEDGQSWWLQIPELDIEELGGIATPEELKDLEFDFNPNISFGNDDDQILETSAASTVHDAINKYMDKLTKEEKHQSPLQKRFYFASHMGSVVNAIDYGHADEWSLYKNGDGYLFEVPCNEKDSFFFLKCFEKSVEKPNLKDFVLIKKREKPERK